MARFIYPISPTKFHSTEHTSTDSHQYLIVAYSEDLEIVSYAYSAGAKTGVAALASELGSYSYSSYHSGKYLKDKRITDHDTLEQFVSESDFLRYAVTIDAGFRARFIAKGKVHIVAFENGAYLNRSKQNV